MWPKSQFEVLKLGGCTWDLVHARCFYLFSSMFLELEWLHWQTRRPPETLVLFFFEIPFASRKAEFDTLPDSMFTIFRDLAKFLVQVNFTKHHWHPVLKLTVTIVQEKLDVVGRNWNRLEQFLEIWPQLFRGKLHCPCWGGKTPGCFTEGCRLLSTVGTVGWIGPGVGWISGDNRRSGIDLQVVRMMERHYKNGFVGPRFMTLEVGGKCRFFLGGWKLQLR